MEYLSRHNGESICYGFEKMNIPFAADIVNFVIILALFSSINSGVYASSRLLYFRLKDKKDP